MNFDEMFKDLISPRKSVTIGKHVFYARPMTVKEYIDHIMNPEKSDRDELTILRCIQDEQGKPIFSDIEQVKQLYTVSRSELIGLVSQVSIVMELPELEKKSETTPS
ncbi:hypothetical protein [Buttiauxella noackiae]|uniref:hypothetical protein n=1 Tax=Buttiauxella noackiae TaxID=82992 RepID=UPI000554A970|nr:hypothetical protein [Buttiauxella noackiae]